MKSRVRNTIVGATVLGAIIILGVGIYRFGSAPATFFKPPQINVVFESERGDGLGDGSTINYLGIEAGRVISVRREGAAVVIDAFLYKDPPIPANVSANIVFTSPSGGVSSLDLHAEGAPAAENLKDGARLKARYLGSTFIPPEFAQAAVEIKDAVREVRVTVKQFNDAKLLETLNATIVDTRAQINAAGEVVKSVNGLVADPVLKANLQKSLDAIARASEDAAVVSNRIKGLTDRFESITQKTEKAVEAGQQTIETANKRIDQVGQEMGDRLRQLSTTLDHVNAIAAKINDGKGTAGKLVNDPKLYQSLVDSSSELTLAIGDLRRLLQQWEQEGLNLGKGGVFGK